MEMTDCIEEYKNLNITIPLKENIMTGLKCIKDLDVYLSGSFLEEHISYLSMKVKTCENSTYYPFLKTAHYLMELLSIYRLYQIAMPLQLIPIFAL